MALAFFFSVLLKQQDPKKGANNRVLQSPCGVPFKESTSPNSPEAAPPAASHPDPYPRDLPSKPATERSPVSFYAGQPERPSLQYSRQVTNQGECSMGANRPGTRRKARLRRAKREQERLEKKHAAQTPAGQTAQSSSPPQAQAAPQTPPA
jgi:hypothetical protein